MGIDKKKSCCTVRRLKYNVNQRSISEIAKMSGMFNRQSDGVGPLDPLYKTSECVILSITLPLAYTRSDSKR